MRRFECDYATGAHPKVMEALVKTNLEACPGYGVDEHCTHAAQLMVIWGIIALFRRLGEPKILGDQTGLSPILSLVGIYVGMLLGGVLGMIVGPLLLLVFINLTKLGIFSPVMADLSAAASDVAAILKSGHRK